MSFMPMRACANIDPSSTTAAPTRYATSGREEAPREQVQEERQERPEHDARDAPRERLSPGLDALDRIAPRDDELVVLAVDAEEPIRLAHRCRGERRRAVRLDRNDLPRDKRVEELRAWHDRQRFRALREVTGSP